MTYKKSNIPSVPTPGLVTMVDLGAHKCIPCKMMAPIIAELQKEYAGRASIVFIDVWEHREQAQRFGIRSIPTQIFYDKQLVFFFFFFFWCLSFSYVLLKKEDHKHRDTQDQWPTFERGDGQRYHAVRLSHSGITAGCRAPDGPLLAQRGIRIAPPEERGATDPQRCGPGVVTS